MSLPRDAAPEAAGPLGGYGLLGADVRAGALGEPPGDPLVDERDSERLVRLVADRRTAQLDVAGRLGFQVDDGSRVVVAAAPGTDDAEVAMWLHGTVAALVLGQQGRTALHASTVAVGEGAVAIAGRRDAGKSTTALELRRRGHRLVTDDVSPVDPVAGGRPMVVPFGRALHVWPETAERLGVDVGDAPPVAAASAKLSVPVTTEEGAELTHVVVLDPAAGVAEVGSIRVTGAEAVTMVGANAYRVEVISRLWPAELFRWTTWLPTVVAVHVVRRPEEGWSVTEVVNTIETLVAGG
ncbi:MAG TPA: hypothetical protein VMN58_02615 [Acidimicrobiales bacterium]|nr:hypothetical protein [Acidimicrobiales bacterium]